MAVISVGSIGDKKAPQKKKSQQALMKHSSALEPRFYLIIILRIMRIVIIARDGRRADIFLHNACPKTSTAQSCQTVNFILRLQ